MFAAFYHGKPKGSVLMRLYSSVNVYGFFYTSADELVLWECYEDGTFASVVI